VVEQSAPDPKLPFERLGDYDVLAPISEGGMASVWLGRSTVRANDLAALKVIRAEHSRNKDFVAMLVDEAGIATRLTHPNILSTKSFGHDGKRHFLVMELLRGRSLLDVRKAAHAQGKRIPVEVVAWIGARVADALHHAHDLKDADGAPLGVVHRDVNPANIFITRDGDPKLIDFGLAKARDRIASTAIGVVKGKLAYLAPEQTLGHAADRRSDVFALGVTLWEISLDRRLFLDEDDVETVRRVREAAVPDPTTIDADYPRELGEALARALAREPAKRWQTAADLRDALDAFVASTGRPVGAANVRALLHDLFASETPAAWERIADESASEQERTRIWNERKEAGEPLPAPPPLPAPLPPPVVPHAAPAPPEPPRSPSVARERPPRASPSTGAPSSAWPAWPASPVWLVAALCAAGGGVLGGVVVRGCRPADAGLDQRVARLEDLLGVVDAGMTPPPSAGPGGEAGPGAVVAIDDHAGPCAVAKIASYAAWQEAVTKAKLNAGPAEAACADIRSEKKKQSCFYFATAQTHSTQAARDAVITGGAAGEAAVRSVKDDPKNPAIARARAASEAAFTACGDDAGS
jgi:serine/threonine protein kinase